MQNRATLLAFFGLPETASLAQARAAYRQMALRLHPDTQSGNTDAMAQANLAWDALRATFKKKTGPRSTHKPEAYAREINLTGQIAAHQINNRVLPLIIDTLMRHVRLLKKTSRRERWFGEYTSLDPHLNMDFHVPDALFITPAGEMVFHYNAPLRPGVSAVFFPAIEQNRADPTQFELTRRIGHFHFKIALTQRSVSVSMPDVIKARLAFEEAGQPTAHIDTAHPSFFSNCATHQNIYIRFGARRLQRLLNGTMPHALRPAARRLLDACDAWARWRAKP